MKNLPLLLAVLLAAPAFSQSFEFQKGPVYTDKQLDQKLDIAAKDIARTAYGQPLYTFENKALKKTYSYHGYKKGKMVMGIWNDYLTLSSVAYIGGFELPGKEAQLQVVKFITRGDKNYLFYTIRVELNDLFTLYVLELDGNMVAQGSGVKIEEYTQAVKFGYSLRIKESENKQNIVIFRDCINDFSYDTKKIQVKVIDKSFGEIWKKEISFKDDWRGVFPSEFFLDKSNDLIIHASFAKTLIKPLLDNRKFVDGLIIYFPQTDEQVRLQPGLPENDNFGANFEWIDNRVVIAGLTKNRGEVKYYLQRLSADKRSLELVASNLVPPRFMDVFNDGDNKLEYWSVHNIVQLDGYWAISLESVYQNIYSPDAFVIAFDESGKEKWQHTVRKFQQTPVPMIEMIGNGTTTLILYNDMASNLKKTIDEKPKKTSFGDPWAIIVHEIDRDGKAKKYQLSKDPDFNNCIISVDKFDEIGDNTFLTYTLDGNFYRDKVNTYQRVLIKVK